jgi:type IV pilus assembly protein PilQ
MKKLFFVIIFIILPALIFSHPKSTNSKDSSEDRDPFQKMNNNIYTDVIKLNHVQAQTAANIIANKTSGFLSKNGRMVVDAQTNTIFLKDTPESLKDIRFYLKKMDVPNRQIVIRVRVVSVNNNFSKELGLRYFSRVREGLNMDLPAALENSGQLGFTLAKLSKNNLLDLELSALESEGYGKIISRPELITGNQRLAYIEAGDQIPYQSKGAHGATNTVFKKAVLSLRVLPEIVPDNKIILHLAVNHDKASPTLLNGSPVIQTRAIRTDVLANNGETVVLGGIYEETNSSNLDKIPFLSRLPFLGSVFGVKKRQASNSQLLIFVTPQIM